MEFKYDAVRDRKELRRLVRLLIFDKVGQVVSGMSMRVDTSAMYGIHIDHHEFAYELDALCTQGKVKHHAYHGGDTQYVVLERN